jgi:hypothetical protein
MSEWRSRVAKSVVRPRLQPRAARPHLRIGADVAIITIAAGMQD